MNMKVRSAIIAVAVVLVSSCATAADLGELRPLS